MSLDRIGSAPRSAPAVTRASAQSVPTGNVFHEPSPNGEQIPVPTSPLPAVPAQLHGAARAASEGSAALSD